VKAYICIALIMSLVLVARSSNNSVEVTLEDSSVPQKPLLTDADLARYKAHTIELGSKIKAAFARGKAAAEKHIKAGRFPLRAFGKPVDKNETDFITGYRIERIGPRNQSNSIFSDVEVNGYNSTMRDWHAKHRKRFIFDPSLHPTALRHPGYDVDLSRTDSA
jgi:hypothetical protein